MSTFRPGDRTPIRGLGHLRETLVPKGWNPGRLGIEWELLPCGFRGAPVPYAGPCGVGRVFGALSKTGYGAIREGRRVVGLSSPSGSILGLEPGAQVEVATPPGDSLEKLGRELGTHYGALAGEARALGWEPRAWGFPPQGGPEDHPDVPKARYAILGDHLRKTGTRGRWMMKLTAASQFNLDTPGEATLDDQTDGALRILPYLAGWLANSPVVRGAREHRKSQRADIWRRTDRARCGLPPFLFRGGDPVGRWLRYYLSRTALFFVRDGLWIPGDGRTFRQVLRAPGHLGALTLEDWKLHISGAFPDIRYRGYLELRVADSVPLDILMGASALCKGLLGDPDRIRSWRSLLPNPGPASTRDEVLRASGAGGGWIPSSGPMPKVLAPRLFRAARQGLRALGEDGAWLEPLEGMVGRGLCPADSWVLKEGAWEGPGALELAVPRGGAP